jgi:hypothetical protein
VSAVPAPATDRAALSDVERRMLEYALNLADAETEHDDHGISDDEQDALAALRRLVSAPAAAVLPAPPDRGAVRDLIADLLADVDGWKWVGGFDKARSPAYQGYQKRAAEVLAVLPASIDRGASVRSSRETEAELYVLLRKAGEDRYDAQALIDRHRDEALRRMADEPPQPERPRRGDEVEAWLKAQRDGWFDDTGAEWHALDGLLDRYRLHADTGTPLGEHVCEGRVVGDCECLEAPAAVAQPDGEA